MRKELRRLSVVLLLAAGAWSSMASAAPSLKRPYTWFGAKTRAADLIWGALGDVPNYDEPFAGSAAVVLARPHEPRREVLNDINAFVVNFWRCVRSAPELLFKWADEPPSELNQNARHPWLVAQERQLRERLLADPEYCDAKVGGWWVWGLSGWIGTGWCPGEGQTLAKQIVRARLGGIHTLTLDDVHALARRMRRVILTCGDWQRVLTPAYTTGEFGLTGVLLDPPYAEGTKVYADDDQALSARVRRWALDHGDDPEFRIVLCGYEGEHKMPKRWRCVPWVAQGGYGNRGKKRGDVNNRFRERLWLSPHCLEVA